MNVLPETHTTFVRRACSRALSAGLVLAAMLGATSTGNAQTTSASQPLSIPSHERLLCKTERPTDAEAKGGVRTHVKIEIAAPVGFSGRTDEVWYDSAGHVLSLIEIVMYPPAGTETSMDAITSSFAPTGQGAGRHMRYAASQGSRTTSKTASLTAEELDNVRKLAAWLWVHRCPETATSRPRSGGDTSHARAATETIRRAETTRGASTAP